MPDRHRFGNNATESPRPCQSGHGQVCSTACGTIAVDVGPFLGFQKPSEGLSDIENEQKCARPKRGSPTKECIPV